MRIPRSRRRSNSRQRSGRRCSASARPSTNPSAHVEAALASDRATDAASSLVLGGTAVDARIARGLEAIYADGELDVAVARLRRLATGSRRMRDEPLAAGGSRGRGCGGGLGARRADRPASVPVPVLRHRAPRQARDPRGRAGARPAGRSTSSTAPSQGSSSGRSSSGSEATRSGSRSDSRWSSTCVTSR